MSGSCFIHLSCCLLLVMFEPWCLKIHSVPYDVDWSISNFRTRNFVTQASKKSALVSDLIRCCRVRTENNLFPCFLLVFYKPRTMRVFSKKKKETLFALPSKLGKWEIGESSRALAVYRVFHVGTILMLEPAVRCPQWEHGERKKGICKEPLEMRRLNPLQSPWRRPQREEFREPRSSPLGRKSPSRTHHIVWRGRLYAIF